MIKNILIDLGGVIITLSPDEAARRFETLGLADAASSLDAYTQSGIFGALESGAIDDEEFRSAFSMQVGRNVTWNECQWAWKGYMKEVPQRNLDALLKLRHEGFHTILASNTNPYMMSWALSNDFDGHGNPLSHYLDTLYMSYRLGVMKPAELYFQKIIAAEGIIPQETLFIDDGKRNIEIAKQLGFHTFLVDNGQDWTKDIYERIKLITNN